MKTFETMVNVTIDGVLTAHVPPVVQAGTHRAVLVFDQPAPQHCRHTNLKVFHLGIWPAELTMRREDLYGEWGR